MLHVVLVIHILITIALVGVILLQRSEGGALGIGGNSSGGLISGRAAGNLLTRITAVLAAAFFIASIALAILSNKSGEKEGGFMDGATPAIEAPATIPAEPVTPQAPMEQ